MIEEYCVQTEGRLDIALSQFVEQTRSHCDNLIDKGLVKVNDKVVTKSGFKVRIDDVITVEIAEPVNLDLIPQDIPINIVYQDSDLVVIDKQQGLVVHPAVGNWDGTLVNALLFHIKDLSSINGVIRPGIVHRLDKDTSGLMVVAKNDKAHVNLALQIASKECRRVYTALVEGVIKEESGSIDMPLGRSSGDRKKMAIVDGGREAITNYTVVKRYANNTLVSFELKTGRTHQIRVHAKYIKHPIVGDLVYGYKNQKFKLQGQLLHANKIMFTHPTTGEAMEFNSPLPKYFTDILNKLQQ